MQYINAELLAPAGSPEALDAAIGEGADAVYLGLKSFNARMRSSNFAYSQFEGALDSIRSMRKKLYVTVNTVFEQREADRMYQFLEYLEKVGPDGIIVQDLGVAKMAVENFPRLKLHASTQMNVGSSAAVNFLSRTGFKRVVLSRELSIEELRSVRAETNLELESFVHGALCVSASGLCLFSSYLGGRSANRGTCTQACRRLYSDDTRDGYFFSPNDLQLVEKVPDLIEAGIGSFKIEGRMKSAEYVSTVVSAYRYMLDNWRFDRERAATKARAMLQEDFARRKTIFWFDGKPEPDYIRPEQAGGTGIPLGKIKQVRSFDDKLWMLLSSYDGIAEGDSIRIHSHGDAGRSTAKVRGIMEKTEGLYLHADQAFGTGDEVYLIQTRSMARRYKAVIPASLAKYHAFPSYHTAPKPGFAMPGKDRLDVLPAGIYAMVNRVQDLHALLADLPEKAILRFSKKNAELLRRHEKEIPFKGNSLVLWLEPFFPQADSGWLAEELDYQVNKGRKFFVANNLGHLNMLRGRDVSVIAGPWLYSFNSWAAAFYLSAGASFIMPPLEISKQAYARLLDTVPARAFFPVVFANPQLFTIRGNLGELFSLRFFRDREEEEYELLTDADESVVIPVKPFSIVDRIPFLKKDGTDKFLMDFSFLELKKQVYKRVMAAGRNGTVLPETGRFNWKDGFWNPAEEKPSKSRDAGDRQFSRADSYGSLQKSGAQSQRTRRKLSDSAPADTTGGSGKMAGAQGSRVVRAEGYARPKGRNRKNPQDRKK
ncbi:peptidase U32 family protein [Spirochaetota bacterium]